MSLPTRPEGAIRRDSYAKPGNALLETSGAVQNPSLVSEAGVWQRRRSRRRRGRKPNPNLVRQHNVANRFFGPMLDAGVQAFRPPGGERHGSAIFDTPQ